ncbi:endopeptidase La [bacterium]|nr:endopeptidase La [bacterium]
MVVSRVPVMIVNETVLFPNFEYRIETQDEKTERLINIVEQSKEKQILMIHSLDGFSTDNVIEFPSLGVLSTLTLKLLVPNSKTRAVFQCHSRVSVSNYEFENGVWYVDIEDVETREIPKDKNNLYIDMLLRSYEKYSNLVSNTSNAMLHQLSFIESLADLTDSLAAILPFSIELKKKYLYEKDVIKRATSLLEQLKEEIALAKIENKIDEKVRQEVAETQRKFYLQAKLKVIKDELGEETTKNREIAKYEKRLKKLKANKKIKDRIKEEIKRYETSTSISPEVGMIKDYIEWMLSLPFEIETKDITDLNEIKKTLDDNHYGMSDVKERILEYIAVKQNSKKEKSPILCLIGPPGVGKTSLAYSVAKSLNRNVATISVGGINDEAEIVGHRRTYVGALPGRIIQGMKKAHSSNPVFIIDEIDKMTKSVKGDPASSLLEVLDKEQNMYFSDHYIEEDFDLSKVLFIATANYEEQIPLELKDRLEIIHIPSYTEYEKKDIAINYLIPKLMDEVGLTSFEVTIDKEAILEIIRCYTKEAGVRELSRMISKILRKIVKKRLIENSSDLVTVTKETLEDYLGKEIYPSYYQKENLQVGVVNGLAYTPFGGDILKIETTYYKGKGNLILTGSLGDVIKESASIALSYIKANCDKFNVSDLIFASDIHIHLPEGAVNKEGPSAGVALTTSIISAFSNKKVSSKLAMTGEITLQGNVLPIGGVREKVLGAYRTGVKKIYLPLENKKDLEEVSKEIRDKLEFILVSNYDEIFESIFC